MAKKVLFAKKVTSPGDEYKAIQNEFNVFCALFPLDNGTYVTIRERKDLREIGWELKYTASEFCRYFVPAQINEALDQLRKFYGDELEIKLI